MCVLFRHAFLNSSFVPFKGLPFQKMLDVWRCIFEEVMRRDYKEAFSLRLVCKSAYIGGEKCLEGWILKHFPGAKADGASRAGTVAKLLGKSEERWTLGEGKGAGLLRWEQSGYDDLGVFYRSHSTDGEIRIKEMLFDTLMLYFSDLEDPKKVTPRVREAEVLGAWLRSGYRVFPSYPLLYPLMEMLYGPGEYFCKTGTCVFTAAADLADLTEMDRIFGLPDSGDHTDNFIIRVDRPRFAAGVRQGDLARCDSFARCDSLLLNAMPIHGVLEERVQYYVERFKADTSYLPCVLLAASSFDRQWGINAVMLDGHHKLHAAIRLARPIQYILFDRWYEEFPPFFWARATSKDAYQYLVAHPLNMSYEWDEESQLPRALPRHRRDAPEWEEDE